MEDARPLRMTVVDGARSPVCLPIVIHACGDACRAVSTSTTGVERGWKNQEENHDQETSLNVEMAEC